MVVVMVSMGMFMCVRCIGVCWVHFYDCSSAGDTVFHSLFKTQAELSVEFEACQCGCEYVGWHTGINKGTKCHVAANAREAVKIGDFHVVIPFPYF